MIQPGQPGIERSEDVPADGLGVFGHFRGGKVFKAIGSDERRDIAFADAGDGGDIHEELVHADPADHRAALSTDKYLAAIAEAAAPAIGVADRDEGDL